MTRTYILYIPQNLTENRVRTSISPTSCRQQKYTCTVYTVCTVLQCVLHPALATVHTVNTALYVRSIVVKNANDCHSPLAFAMVMGSHPRQSNGQHGEYHRFTHQSPEFKPTSTGRYRITKQMRALNRDPKHGPIDSVDILTTGGAENCL